MSISLNLGWFSNALVTQLPKHHSHASLIVANGVASVLTFPYCAETICVKSTALTTAGSSDGLGKNCILLSDFVRDFIKKCDEIFESITLEIIGNDMVLSLQNQTQALKYQLPVIIGNNRDVVQSSEDIELFTIGQGLLRSWRLFDKKVTITASSGQKNIKIECEKPKICTLFACQNAPPSACSFKCSASSLNILQLLSPNMAISIVFMSSGLLLVKNNSEKIYIAPGYVETLGQSKR
tara:strand:+ start:971 stop:1684 length:714 start_codon:yes stop_codon:yes gene_type:complete